MGNNAQGGFAGGNPLSGASGSGTMTPQSYGSSPMMSGGTAGPSLGGNLMGPQQQQYMQYLSQAMPAVQNAWKAGTLPQGQMPSNFQSPQSFGLPAGGVGGTMPGGGIGSGGHK